MVRKIYLLIAALILLRFWLYEFHVISVSYSLHKVGRIEEWRNIQWTFGQLRHMDEYQFA